MLSPFGVEHSVSKSRRRDGAAAAVGAGVGGVVGADVHNQVHLGSARRQGRMADEHVAHIDNASPEGQQYHIDSARRHAESGKAALRRFRSKPLRTATGLGGAALGAAAAAGASRATSRRGVAKSAFGVEHPEAEGQVSKALSAHRIERARVAASKVGRRSVQAGRVIGLQHAKEDFGNFPTGSRTNWVRHRPASWAAKEKLQTLSHAPGERHLTRVNMGGGLTAAGKAATAGTGVAASGAAAIHHQRRTVTKSAFGVEHSLATGTVPARLRLSGPQAPPQAKPAKPPAQRLNNAIAATGGPSS